MPSRQRSRADAPERTGEVSRRVGDATLPDPITEWRVHRFMTGVMLGIVVLAAAGFAGDGGVSRRTVRADGGLIARYSVVERLSHTGALEIADAGHGGAACIFDFVQQDTDAWFTLSDVGVPTSSQSRTDEASG